MSQTHIVHPLHQVEGEKIKRAIVSCGNINEMLLDFADDIIGICENDPELLGEGTYKIWWLLHEIRSTAKDTTAIKQQLEQEQILENIHKDLEMLSPDNHNLNSYEELVRAFDRIKRVLDVVVPAA